MGRVHFIGGSPGLQCGTSMQGESISVVIFARHCLFSGGYAAIYNYHDLLKTGSKGLSNLLQPLAGQIFVGSMLYATNHT